MLVGVNKKGRPALLLCLGERTQPLFADLGVSSEAIVGGERSVSQSHKESWYSLKG